MFREAQPSFVTGDAVLDEAAGILQLLHMEELRETQTRIIAAIVAVHITAADPNKDRPEPGEKLEGEHIRIPAPHSPSMIGNHVHPHMSLEIKLHTFKESIPEYRLCFRDLPSLLFLY